MIHFDPRTKIFVMILLGLLIFMTERMGTIILLVFSAVYLVLQGKNVRAVKFAVGFCLLYALEFAIQAYGSNLLGMFGFIVFLMARFIPVLMAASVLSDSPPAELMTALRKMHVPGGVIIALAVGLRFMPCIFQEFSVIRDAMQMRRISFISLRTLVHPILSLELLIVPLLVRTMKISDELSVSASVRGIDNPGKRTCLQKLRFSIADGIALGIFCVAGVLLLFV